MRITGTVGTACPATERLDVPLVLFKCIQFSVTDLLNPAAKLHTV
jgi:hypothetical protein